MWEPANFTPTLLEANGTRAANAYRCAARNEGQLGKIRQARKKRNQSQELWMLHERRVFVFCLIGVDVRKGKRSTSTSQCPRLCRLSDLRYNNAVWRCEGGRMRRNEHWPADSRRTSPLRIGSCYDGTFFDYSQHAKTPDCETPPMSIEKLENAPRNSLVPLRVADCHGVSEIQNPKP